MKPEPIPTHVREEFKNHQCFIIGPPKGISEEDCGSIEALVGTTHEAGVFDGAPEFRVYWKPDEEELKHLLAGMPIEIVMSTYQMIPHSVGVVYYPEPLPEKEDREIWHPKKGHW